MSEVATAEMEAQKSRRKSTRMKKEVIKYEEKPSKKTAGGAVKKTNSNGVAADSKKESEVSIRSSRLKLSGKDTEDRTDQSTATPAAARRTPLAVDGKGKEGAAAERKKATRTKRASRVPAASDDLEAVAASREQDKASGAVRKDKASVRKNTKASKLSPSRKVSRRSGRASSGSRRASSDRKRPSNSRSSRKGPAHRDSYSDESHSCSCTTHSDSDTSSDGLGSVSCSCSECEFEDRIRGEWKPASKKQTPKVVKKYRGIYTPD